MEGTSGAEGERAVIARNARTRSVGEAGKWWMSKRNVYVLKSWKREREMKGQIKKEAGEQQARATGTWANIYTWANPRKISRSQDPHAGKYRRNDEGSTKS